MKRLLACPGSRLLSRGIPDETSPFAEEGTRAHDVCEQALLTRKHPKKFTDDPEMINAALIYVEAIAEWKARFATCTQWVEETLQSVELDILGGTGDCMLFGEDEDGNFVLQVCDFKYGVGVPVGVEHNEQLLTYCALGQQWLSFLGIAHRIDIYRLMIVQPRASSNDTVQVWECDQSVVDEHYASIKEILNPDNKDKLSAGSHCRWCPVLRSKEGCPEYKRHMVELQQAAEQEAMDLFEHAEDKYSPEMIEQWVKYLEIAPAIKKFLDTIPGHLLAAAKEGNVIPGYKVVTSHGHRKFNRDGKELSDALRANGVPANKLYEPRKVKSPAKLEREGYGTALDGLVYKPEVGFKVVPNSSRGEPVQFKSLFAEFD